MNWLRALVPWLLAMGCASPRVPVAADGRGEPVTSERTMVLEPSKVELDGGIIADATKSGRRQRIALALQRGPRDVGLKIVASDAVRADMLKDAYFAARDAGISHADVAFLPRQTSAGAASTPPQLKLIVSTEAFRLCAVTATSPSAETGTVPRPATRPGRLPNETATVEDVKAALREECSATDACNRAELRVSDAVSVGTLKRVLRLVAEASASLGSPLGIELDDGASRTAVSGRLPPSDVQRVVRDNFAKIRSCYQAGLARDGKLEGRVVARFVIGRDGTVTNVADGGSDLPDPEVVSCALKTFYELKFPAPEAGIVVVVYPISLAPS